MPELISIDVNPPMPPEPVPMEEAAPTHTHVYESDRVSVRACTDHTLRTAAKVDFAKDSFSIKDPDQVPYVLDDGLLNTPVSYKGKWVLVKLQQSLVVQEVLPTRDRVHTTVRTYRLCAEWARTC